MVRWVARVEQIVAVVVFEGRKRCVISVAVKPYSMVVEDLSKMDPVEHGFLYFSAQDQKDSTFGVYAIYTI